MNSENKVTAKKTLTKRIEKDKHFFARLLVQHSKKRNCVWQKHNDCFEYSKKKL